MSVPFRRIAVSVCLLVASLLSAQAHAQLELRCPGGRARRRGLDQQRRGGHGRRAAAVPRNRAAVRIAPGDSQPAKLDPTKDEFDLVRAIEYSASPIHFIVGRDDTQTASLFITDLRNGELSVISTTIRDFRRRRARRPKAWRPRTGAHVQAEPEHQRVIPRYLRRRRPVLLDADIGQIDPALAAVFASTTPVYTPNTSYYMSNDTQSQFAMAVTGGYRARISRAGGGSWTGCTSERTIIISMVPGTNICSLRRDLTPTRTVY